MDGNEVELVARAGVIYSQAVTTRTTVYLLRLRSRLTIKRAGVDLTDAEVIGTVMVRWNEILDEMEKLLFD